LRRTAASHARGHSGFALRAAAPVKLFSGSLPDDALTGCRLIAYADQLLGSIH
jgi:hypothetical protein